MAKKKKSSFRGKVSKDSQRQKRAGSSYGYLQLPKGIPVYSPTPGAREKIDIIPYTVSFDKHPDRDDEYQIAQVGDLWYKRPFRTHRQVGADNETVVCLTSFGKKCPICEYRKKRAKEGADKDELKAYNSSQRNLYLVIPRGVKKREEEIHIFDMSQYLFQNLLNEELEEDEQYEVFPDLEEGLTLRVRWSEESFGGNKYAEANRIDFIERHTLIEEDLIEDIPDLDKVLIELPYKEMELKFFEMDEDSEEETEEEPPVKTRKKKSVKTRKKKSVKPTTKTEEEEEEDLTWDDLNDMDFVELAEVVEDRALDIDADDYEEDEDELRKDVADQLGIKQPKKKPVKETKKKPSKQVKSKPSGKCPFKHKFGVDTDEYDDCDDCDIWDDCIDAQEEGGV